MKKALKKVCIIMVAVMLVMSFVSCASVKTIKKSANTVDGTYSGKTVILHSNDTHGAVTKFTYMAGLKQYFEEKGATVILVDDGDFSQGSVYVSVSKGADAVTLLEAVGYDVVALGNHEFDYGPETLKENLENFSGTVVCSDVLDADGEPLFDENVIIQVGGLKIAFFGLETPETQTKVNPGLIKGYTFYEGEELYQVAQEQADLLSKKADIVICLAHLGVDDESVGNRSTDVYAAVTGIDFVIDGHSHTVMEEGPNGEPIQSTGTQFQNIGVIVIDNKTKEIQDNYLLDETFIEKYEDELVTTIGNAIVTKIDAQYGATFATSQVELNGAKAPSGNRDSETNLGDLITDAMVWQVKKDLDVDEDKIVAITNGGGIRAWLHTGEISMKDVNTVLPFGNTIATVYIKGSQLLEALEASTYCTPASVGGFPQVSGIEFTLNTKVAYDKGDQYPGSTYYGPKSIQRVTINSINGKAFDPDETYVVITNNFCAVGGDTYYSFAACSDQFDTGIPMDEALVNYITEELGGVIGSEYANPQGRITIL